MTRRGMFRLCVRDAVLVNSLLDDRLFILRLRIVIAPG